MEEARETPVLNVVDPANLPDRKSFPPRLVLIIASSLLCVIAAGLWILALESWQSVSYDDPTKLLAQNVYRSVVDYGGRVVGYLPWDRLKALRRERFRNN
jgi:hypothetical protein